LAVVHQVVAVDFSSPPAGDATEWNALLAVWPRAHLLQSFGWGVLQSTLGWDVRRVRADAGGRVLPLTVLVGRPLPGLPPRVYMPKGPACAPDDAVAWAAALEELGRLARAEGAVAVAVEPHGWAEEDAALDGLFGPQWQLFASVQPRHTALVDLRGGEAQVLARMRPKGRYNARLAERRGVVVSTPKDPVAASVTLARLCAATGARQGIHQPDAGHLLGALLALPGALIHIAEVDGEPVAGAFVATFAGQAIYLYGGSTTRHRELQPSALLHLAAMRAAIDEGCHTYDLWGIPPDADPGHPWHGLRQFKLSLGGAERTAASARQRVLRPLASRAIGAAEEARAAARRARVLARSALGRAEGRARTMPYNRARPREGPR